jgi:hypothetical protein
MTGSFIDCPVKISRESSIGLQMVRLQDMVQKTTQTHLSFANAAIQQLLPRIELNGIFFSAANKWKAQPLGAEILVRA